MSTQAIEHKAEDNSMKMLQAMVGIGILCALLIVSTFQFTLPIIKKNKAEALEKAIFNVLPGIEKKQAFMINEAGEFEAVIGDDVPGEKIYAGYNANNELVGYVVEASGMGFADVLRILYGYDPEKQAVVGFHVLESKETPGLGDKIEKDPAFLANFEELDVALSDGGGVKNIVTTVKSGEKTNAWEIDGITGATISSRAIGNIIGGSTSQLVPEIYNNQQAFTWKENE